ncbi:MAG: tryptophan 7-halogenase [Planctomycetota bacterium]
MNPQAPPIGHEVKKVVILGGGTAGLLCAMAFRQQLPDLDVTVVRSTKMGVIGVGEGTIVSVVHFLHNFLGIDSKAFHEQVEPSIKLGIRYLWGSRPQFYYTFSPQFTGLRPNLAYPTGYYCDDRFGYADMTSALMHHGKACLRTPQGTPALHGNFAYHLENKKLVEFLEAQTDQPGLTKVDDLVVDVERGPSGVSAIQLESGQRVAGDFFIDCSGFRSELLGRTLGAERIDFSDALFCDRAVVGGWARTDEPYQPFTTAETMDHGWAWQIEHDDILNRGYVFSSRFASDDEAAEEFRLKNPRLGEVRVIPFPAGVYRETWKDNVIAIGNAAGFVEPLEATAIGMICDGILNVVRVFQSSGCRPMPAQRSHYNQMIFKNWEIIRDFLALHYKYNGRLQTPFWETARNEVSIGALGPICEYYEQVGPDFSLLTADLKRDFFGAEGYLAMLVGQDVGYERSVEPTEADRAQWESSIKAIGLRARDGMGVMECCRHLRQHGLPGNVRGQGALGWS